MNRIHILILVIAFSSGLLVAVDATAEEVSVIAPEIGRLIAEDGVPAAQAQFKELLNTDSINHVIEIQALQSLMSDYMQAGNMEAGMAVAEMSSELTMQMLSSGGVPGVAGMDMEQLQKMEEAEKAQQKLEREEEQKLAEQKEQQGRGESRDDLQRFAGFYEEKGSNDKGRTLFVAVSCDGYLVVGPMWADVGPWWMKPASDLVFSYSDSWTNFSIEFVHDESSGHYTLGNDIDGVASPLEWTTELTREYAKCVERPRR